MPYLVDSDLIIDLLGNVESALKHLEALSADGIAISVVTYMEVYQGLDRASNRAGALQHFEMFLEGVPVTPFSLAVARRCARLRQQLKMQKKKVNSRALDLIIAATALEHDLILVTRNGNDYSDIPELKLLIAE